MNTDQLTMLLARIQVLDNRQVDELTIQAWTPLMADVDYGEAVWAVNTHFRESTEYLKPAHITKLIAAKRAARPLTMSEPTPEDCGDHRLTVDGTCARCLYRKET